MENNLQTPNQQSPTVATAVTPSPVALKPNKLSIPLLVLTLLVTAAVGVGGYFLGRDSAMREKGNFPEISPTPAQSACTLEVMVCPDGTKVSNSGPNCEFAPCPTANSHNSDWIRKQYISNKIVVWDVLQPPLTVAQEGGLHEGYLGLTSTLNNDSLMAEFSFPLFDESGIPNTFDEWLVQYQNQNLGDTFVDRSIIEIPHPQGVQMKMIITTSLSPGGIKDMKMPVVFVLIWKHTNNTGNSQNPSIVVIKPVSNPELDSNIVKSFAIDLAQGLRF